MLDQLMLRTVEQAPALAILAYLALRLLGTLDELITEVKKTRGALIASTRMLARVEPRLERLEAFEQSEAKLAAIRQQGPGRGA